MEKLFLPALLIILSTFFLTHRISDGSLADWDEATHAQISKEILLTGDHLTMHYNNRLWFNKPPLFFNLLALNYKYFGISTFTSRILPAIFGALTVAVTYLVGRELAGWKAGLAAALILATSPQFIWKSRMTMLDVPVTFFLTASMYFFLKTRKHKSGYGFLGLFLGLSVMTKGVVGLLPALIIAAYLAVEEGKLEKHIHAYKQTIIIFLAVTLPWHIHQTLKHGAMFIDEYLGQMVVERAQETITGHSGSLFYLQVLREGLGYWFYPLTIIFTYNLLFEHGDKPLRLPLAWAAITLGVFTLSQTKLPWYIIPAYPALALVTAITLTRLKPAQQNSALIIFGLILALQIQAPTPFYCNNELLNIQKITGGDLRTHDSVDTWPAELFYLGSTRYPDNELLEENAGYYLANFKNHTKFKEKLYQEKPLAYRGRQYMLFTDTEKAVNQSLLPPTNPYFDECYPFFKLLEDKQ